MNRIDFKNRVVEHPGMEFMGMPLPTHEVVVKRLSDMACIAVPFDDIPNQKWSDYEEAFLGLRDFRLMRTMARIVGYYSRTDNWNPSKIAELRDRHRGHYGIPEGQYKWEATHA